MPNSVSDRPCHCHLPLAPGYHKHINYLESQATAEWQACIRSQHSTSRCHEGYCHFVLFAWDQDPINSPVGLSAERTICSGWWEGDSPFKVLRYYNDIKDHWTAYPPPMLTRLCQIRTLKGDLDTTSTLHKTDRLFVCFGAQVLGEALPLDCRGDCSCVPKNRPYNPLNSEHTLPEWLRHGQPERAPR